ncbi:PLxRFG domain-containing protein, partial [Flavobacterium sp.]|uniref:PLxRFG domain-containing protein n=1 Tax=Flavobacterium sp. TaxID=239 RepID=UPI0037BFCDF2
ASEVANGVFPDRYGRYKDASWQALGERLKAALTEEEYAQAKRTTQYAHYTSDPVIRSLFDGLQRLGFAGGSILEPGLGVGHFIGLMPDNIAANSQYTGIEYDTITGTIAKLLYPESNVIVGDYTRTNLPREFFQVGIGNPPFSSTQILSDPEYKKYRPMLHDYFFMKTIDRIMPGGIQIFITSKGTMDKASDKSRKYLAERSNLLGAIRLPQTAFKDNAGTEVVTDIIFLQKKGEGVTDLGLNWMDVKEVDTPDGKATINEYFADHPEMVLGKHALQGSMYRANEYTVLPPDGDMDQLFAKAINQLPENVFNPQASTKARVATVQDRDFNPKHKKEGGLYISDNGRLMMLDSGSGVDVTHRTNNEGKQIALTEKQKTWLKDYVGIRDALKQAQFDQLNDGNWEDSLKELNKAYDSFVKKHGQIMEYTVIERTNKETGETAETKRYKNDSLLRMDVEGALAYALEQEREDGTLVKGAVLAGRVLEKPRDPEIKTTQDALFVSLNQFGYLDVDEVAKLASTDKASVIRDLGNAIYEAPGSGWALADEYLSGNVVRKLKEARAAADLDPKYKRNVEALLAVQPRPLGPTDITVRLGANWVPASDVAKFAQEVIGDQMEIGYNPVLNKWDLEQRSRSVSEWSFDKATSGSILDSILNNRQIKITWRDSEGKTHVDLESTEKANDIAGKMRERFRSWVWSDPKRSERLVAYYNDNFNNIAPRQFDGSHLTLPGVSSRFKLYPHQKRAVWRIVQQGDTYLAHAVGAGKTMEMIAGGMEERRLGLVKKPMYVVPNHMLAQFSREFLELYPTANIMVADEHNFHSSNRKRFVAQAALNNPDAIVITHSAFGRIGMSDKFYEEFITNQIEEWKTALNDVDKSDRITRKQVERRIEQLEQRLEGRQNKDKKDQVLAFEELGVDRLFVDEFHEFRKLDFATNQGNVSGIDSNGSQRALDLYMKVEYLRSKNPGRALVAASGTPITNTMGELFTAQRFFQPEQLKEDGTESFDAWASQYGDIVTGFEQNAAGGYEMKARFAKFQNVPELMRRVRSFMDILTSSNLGELVKRPDVIGGGRQVEITPVPEGYKEYQQQLQARIRTIRSRKGPPKKGQDIILNVIGDGRFSAIDMRFVDPEAPSDPNSKLNTAITKMVEAYNETKGYEYAGKDGTVEPLKGSSIILFTDIGLGEQSAASRGFDMRGWIEKRLLEAGIPREHIAFMRDHKQHAKKERLFADMREGKKRILIGGKEMETGTNVQKRLTHLFHLDAPWFPASVEQREGRIVRQGNQNQQVKITALATKGSYDSTMWGMNARKARFIEQAMNGDDSVRSLEDVSEASAFEMAAALASGDERYLRLAGLKADVERLARLRQAHYDDQNRLTREKHWAEENVKRGESRTKAVTEAIAKRQPIVAGSFAAKLAGKTYDNREEFGQAAFREFQSLAGDSFMGEKQIGEIGGFPIKVFGIKMQGSGGYAAALHVELPDSDPLLTFPLDPDVSVSGIATRAANQVNGLDRLQAEIETTLKANTAKIEQIEKRLGSVFPEESLLLEKVAELSALETELAKESAEAEAATKSAEQQQDGETPQTNLSRGKGSNGGKGMALRDLNAIVDRARASLKNLPQVHALRHPDSLDLTNPSQRRLYDEIYRRSAENDVEGANHEGDIYLFADNLADEFRAEHVLVNHEVGHYGLREVFGNSGLDPILNTIYMTNAKFRKKADAYREEFGSESNAEAVEEVLVDTPPQELIKLNGWRRIVRYMRDWLEGHGFNKMADRISKLLKAGMTEQQKADLLVADVINAARAWVRNGEPSKSGAIQETKLSSAKTDRDRTNIETAARRMEKFVDEFTNGGLKDSDTILLGETPTVLQALGAEALPVQIDGFTLNKILGAKHRYFITPDLMKQIPEHLYDPLAVFDSPKDGKSGKVVLTELSDAVTGKPVIVAIHLSKKSGRLVVNEISSIYEANAGAQRNKLNESALEYYRNEKSLEQATTLDLSTPLASVVQSAQDLGRNILTEKDVVNTYGTKFSRKPIGEIVRNLQGNAVQFFGNQDLKTFNGLNKTINTQFHKALKDKDFGRVYNLIQSMQNHVATASSRAAELAPGILHRVDNVIDAVKTLVSKSQRQAIEKAGEALFAGTLSGNSVMDGRVWSEPELREKFGLDDTAVALYFQARKAIDGSLDELAAAEAFAMAQNYLPKALREDIIESPEDAEALIMAALGRQIDMGRRVKLDDDSMASMEDAREKASAIFEQAKKLKKAGYAPLMRFGKYDLKVMAIDPATGNLERDENDSPVTLYYSRFESQAKLREAERELRDRYADKLDEIRILPGVVNDNANELYRGVNPETLSVFAEAVGARQAMDDYIRLVRSERSAMKRRLERKGTPGYSLDVQRVLANFITSNARQAAQQLFGTSVNNAIRRIPREKGDVQKEALALRDYVINPDDNGALGSSLMFAWFLGGSPAAALVNMTQPVMMTLPYLSQYGAARASVELTKAVPYAMGAKQITDKDLRAALKKASLQGIVDAQEVFHLYAIGSRQLSAGPRSQAAMTLWGSMFSAVEGMNRRLTFIAAWNMATAKGEKDPFGFAVNAVNQTQGIYNKANRPNAARSTVGRALFTFKTYSIMYVELMNRMWKSGPEGKKAVLLMMAVLILASGIEGLPGAKAIDDLIDTIGQWMGYD